MTEAIRPLGDDLQHAGIHQLAGKIDGIPPRLPLPIREKRNVNHVCQVGRTSV